jgi:hypothetical protein
LIFHDIIIVLLALVNEFVALVQKSRAWVVAVDMGYGHDRAAYPLRHLGNGEVIHANKYQGIPPQDERIWKDSQRFYETISRVTSVPIIGRFLFSLFDRWQAIPKFYPRRDLSDCNFQTKQTYRLIRKGWGKDLIMALNETPKPLLTTFFVPAFMAETHHYRGDIYCVICDTDIARNWSPEEPRSSRIRYIVPTGRAAERLRLYGIRKEHIFVTGFPLPKENVGGYGMKSLMKDVAARIVRLDPGKRFIDNYEQVLVDHFGENVVQDEPRSSVSITFAVGGAGAQRSLAYDILRSLSEKISKRHLTITLVAGIRNDVYRYFRDIISQLNLKRFLNHGISILFDVDKSGYFKKFNEHLRSTDVLWTKPSELSFYTALGIPILIAPPIGSQEVFNQKWLTSIGGGIDALDPRYTDEWLFDWVESGWLAEAAFHGFLDAPKFGTYKIEEIMMKRKSSSVSEVCLL